MLLLSHLPIKQDLNFFASIRFAVWSNLLERDELLMKLLLFVVNFFRTCWVQVDLSNVLLELVAESPQLCYICL